MNYIRFVDRRILRLLNCVRVGRVAITSTADCYDLGCFHLLKYIEQQLNGEN